MSQMPEKIWLHKNTKYSTGDIVCGYQYDFVQGIEDEGGIENFVEYVPVDAFIEKVAKWLEENASNFVALADKDHPAIGDTKATYGIKSLIHYFKQEMKL